MKRRSCWSANHEERCWVKHMLGKNRDQSAAKSIPGMVLVCCLRAACF